MVDKIYESVATGEPISRFFGPDAKISYRDDSREPEELSPEGLDDRLKQKVRKGSKAIIGFLCCTPAEHGCLVSVMGQYPDAKLNFQDTYVMHLEEKLIYLVTAHFLLFPDA